MSRRGWCPLHDRVFEAPDGRCPECGTSLVAVTDPARKAVAPEPVVPDDDSALTPVLGEGRPGRWRPRAAVAAAIAAAFALGFVIPHARQVRNRPPLQTASEDTQVLSPAAAGATTLVLDRVKQDGDAVTLTFTVLDGFVDTPDLTGAAIVASTRRGSAESESGMIAVHVFPLVSPIRPAFQVTGRLETGSGRIVGITVTSLQFAVRERPTWPVDISGVWPARGAEPNVLHIDKARRAGDGTIRLVSIVTWSDRLEASFQLVGLNPGGAGGFVLDGVVIDTLGGPAENRRFIPVTLPAVVLEQTSSSGIVARFQHIPTGNGPFTIRASRLSRLLIGPWSWRWE